MTVAAVAVMLLGLGAVWWAIDRETGADSPISTQPSASQPSPGVSTPETIPSALPAQPRGWEGYGRPRFLFGEPGWTMSYASETSHGHGRAVVFLSDAGFDGAWVEISPTEVYEAGALPVRQVGSMSAQVSVFDEGALGILLGRDRTARGLSRLHVGGGSQTPHHAPEVAQIPAKVGLIGQH